jgi:hypothetical protein
MMVPKAHRVLNRPNMLPIGNVVNKVPSMRALMKYPNWLSSIPNLERIKGANIIKERTINESINNAIKAMAATERCDTRGADWLCAKDSSWFAISRLYPDVPASTAMKRSGL